MFIDTHTHLYEPNLITDPEQINRALKANVGRMYMPNCDSETIPAMLMLADTYPENCFPMMGVHPTYIKADTYKQELAIVKEWLEKRKFAAIGEIGLDYYWDTTFKAEQIAAFEQQIDWALQYDLPIVIHSREATEDCIDIVRKKQNGKLKGVFHCFVGTLEEAKAITELGFLLGIGGVSTYRTSTLPEILPHIGLQHLVLETDAPYLAPVPYRGKTNESSYIPVIAHKLATIMDTTPEEVERVTTENALSLFAL